MGLEALDEGQNICKMCHFRFRQKTNFKKHTRFQRKVEIVVKCKQSHFRSRQKWNSRTHMYKTLQQNIQKEATGFRGRSKEF